MRLTPIDEPSSLLGRILTFLYRRQLGRAITPAQVVYNRVPAAWRISLAFLRFEMFGAKLSHEIRLLATTHTAMLNGCAFCQDIKRAFAIRQKLGTRKFDALADWRTSDLFSPAERAALAYVEEATLSRKVSDATFAELAKHFGEREIVELTLSNAIENFYNLVNVPLEIESDGLEAIAASAQA
jgi:alkylhydroperoxidase family enzyme